MDIDLNSDLGEGVGDDVQILQYITSANVSCGFYAGDTETLWRTLVVAQAAGVVVGAHPGHPDREHFGRRELDRPADEVFRECVRQVGSLRALADCAKVPVRYLKPHGGLYHQACREDRWADAVIRCAEHFGLAVMGLPQSRLQVLAEKRVPFIAEGFADRRYRDDGTLVPRSESHAFVDTLDEALAQIERLVQRHGVRSICVHGDNPAAVAWVSALRTELSRRGYRLRAAVA